MKHWLVATYKFNQVKRLEYNLSNQKFDYYLPRITIQGLNSLPKEEVLFPGYIFVKTNLRQYSALKYTKGIKNIIKFGRSISIITDEEIEALMMAQERSKINPISPQIQIGQEATINEGSFKGSMVKIYSLPSKDRVGIFLYFLGKLRRVTIPKENLIF